MFFALLVTGCTTASPPRQAWVAARGGAVVGAAQSRVERATHPLLSFFGQDRVKVWVLHTEEVGAWGWPDGEIFLTKGLIDRLDDTEIAAAVAHELGHLLNDGHLRDVASLNGYGFPLNGESRADMTGVGLLEAQQLPGDAMARMLTKVVHSDRCSASVRRALQCRINLLIRRPRDAR